MKKFWLLENNLISIICISIYIANAPSFAVSNFLDSNPENSTKIPKELIWYPTSELSSLSAEQVTLNLPFNSNREGRSKKNSEKNRNLNDLIQEASSTVEKRNKKVNRNSSQQKSRTAKPSSSKKRQNSKLYRSGSQSSKYNNRDNYRYNNNLRLNVLPYSAYQQRLFYRSNPTNRPLKIVNPKVFLYDFDDYYDYYDNRNRLRADYDSREDDVSKESLEDIDDKASVEETTTEEDNETTTESTTTVKSENATMPGFHGYGYGYGPSHGHEHVSFTYGPNFNDNYWHGQQQFSDTYNPNPYINHFKK